MHLSRIFFISIALSLGIAGSGAVWLSHTVNQPGSHVEAVRIDVREGESVRAVLSDLEQVGAIDNAIFVEWWARTLGGEPRVQVGRYEIAPGATAKDILRQLDEGRVLLESLTVIEGMRYRDFRRLLATHEGVRQTLFGMSDTELMARLGSAGVHPEGRFFPDTYRFAGGTSDLEILKLAHSRLRERLDAAWANRADGLPLSGADQALILASIVEKESGLAGERPRVAGVFVQRLREGMRLQSDPIVIYGLGDAYDGDIRSRDLRTDTPYNSYIRKGLPPTPIALPGETALRAATRPLESGELFFVATGLPDGSHTFSHTYAEHRKALAQMLQRQRNVR
ncbi:MAG: endolytic transglycosylase MltG [Gammaproteobacteria bacterium]|nr:endolytic transglycosylase MltG [Gammaproteobacteria bacterium]